MIIDEFGIHVYDRCQKPFEYEPVRDDIMALFPPGSCLGSLRALMGDGDTVKVAPGKYKTICYNCEEEVDVDPLLTTISGVLTPIPRVAIHPAPEDVPHHA